MGKGNDIDLPCRDSRFMQHLSEQQGREGSFHGWLENHGIPCRQARRHLVRNEIEWEIKWCDSEQNPDRKSPHETKMPNPRRTRIHIDTMPFVCQS